MLFSDMQFTWPNLRLVDKYSRFVCVFLVRHPVVRNNVRLRTYGYEVMGNAGPGRGPRD